MPSSALIHKMLRAYLKADDFDGADMARKFLQMGCARARRYANYKGGKNYDREPDKLNERGTGDPEKSRECQNLPRALEEG